MGEQKGRRLRHTEVQVKEKTMAETKKPAKASTTKKTTAKKPAEKAVKTKKAEPKNEAKSGLGKASTKASEKASESPVKVLLRTVRVDTHLRVREGAGKEFKVIRKLDDGVVVSVYEEKNGFSRIGKDEWVMSSFLK